MTDPAAILEKIERIRWRQYQRMLELSRKQAVSEEAVEQAELNYLAAALDLAREQAKKPE